VNAEINSYLLPAGVLALLAGVLFFSKKRRILIKQYTDIFFSAEEKYGLPRGLLDAMAYVESGYNASAISNKGAVGIMQIIPKYHPNVDPTRPVDSIYYAGQYMAKLFNRYGNWRVALAAYNWGLGNIDQYGMSRLPKETRNYIIKIAGRAGI